MNSGVDSTRAVCPLFQTEEGGSIPTSTLQLEVSEISVAQARALNSYWRSVLPHTYLANITGNRRVVCYGAQYDGRLYAVAIWTSPIAANRLKDGDVSIELRRFAIAPDAPKNSASRLLSVMCRKVKAKFPDVVKAISYQAVDQHKGTIYKAAGWMPAATARQQPWHANSVRFRDGKYYREAERATPQTTSAKIRWEKELTLYPAPICLSPSL